MKTCNHCGTDNAVEHRFCQKCGRSFDAIPSSAEAAPADATRRSGSVAQVPPSIPVDVFTSRSGEPPRAIAVQELFAFKDRLVIGRTPSCDICLPHASVSRKHAVLERLPQGLLLHDLRSVNGEGTYQGT